MYVKVRFMYGGEFYKSEAQRLRYRRNKVYGLTNVDTDLVSKIEFEVMVLEGGLGKDVVKEIWYPMPGVPLHDGLKQLVCDQDIRDICKAVGKDNTIHLYDFRQKWPGKSYKDAVWAAARATTRSDFLECMDRIKGMSEDACKYLMKQDPQTWSLHAFSHSSKSDMLLNNGSESFNSCILEAREMPILSMCEWIRRKLMKMFVAKRVAMSKHTGVVTPAIMKKIEDAKQTALTRCRCYGQDDKFEVDQGSRRYVVDLGSRSCGCNLWDISGVPCCHALCCIMKRRHSVVQYVDPYFTKDTYMRAYTQVVHPMPGKEGWEAAEQEPTLPPELIIQPGRPRKSRRREVGEGRAGKPKRNRFGKSKCSRCGEEGHYKNKCKNPEKAPQPQRTVTNKGGRPPSTSGLLPELKRRRYTKKVRLELPIGAEPPYDMFAADGGSQSTNVTQMTPENQPTTTTGKKKARKTYGLRSAKAPQIVTSQQLMNALAQSRKQGTKNDT